mmetsp:Transcript_25606/g.79005  ORF Transcript_25606/g.79005 Transcript_25606/m.79005 type:complete len:234 (-) Transcript_25606:145-846(-)
MAKSMRSKWKKKMKAEKTKAEAPKKAVRLEKLNEKLGLAAVHKLRNVPLQEPRKEFHFKPPEFDATQRLSLQKFTTNVHKGLRGHEGNADGSVPEKHPQARNPRSPKAAPAKHRRDCDDSDDDVFAAAGGAPSTAAAGGTSTDLDAKYANAAKKMASDFVPTMDQVVSKRARNANKAKASAAANAADADEDDAVAVAAPRSVRLATAAEKKRTGSSKMSKGGATKKSAAPRWK